MKNRVAVIDVGSNSIKALVAESDKAGPLLIPVHEASLEARISKGISSDFPMLSEEGMQAGVDAVVELLDGCKVQGPLSAIQIVATSAVRSAGNGMEFARSVREATGCDLEILSGTEEAEGIARGVQTDPAIGNAVENFSVFDLGGGSMELMRIEDHRVTRRCSLPLGSVRLTERFVADVSNPLPEGEQKAIINHVTTEIREAAFPLTPPLVGCSGGLVVLRQVLADQQGLSFEAFPPVFSKELIDELATRIANQSRTDRIHKSGLPPQRADIFPAALLTLQTIIRMARADAILQSLHNLRFGLAWMLLHPAPEKEGPANQE